MNEPKDPGLLQRIVLAYIAFFAVMFNRRFAGQVQQLRQGGEQPALPPPEKPVPPKPVDVEKQVSAGQAETAQALHLLSILQREGRLIDFLQEDITTFSDAEVGAASRAVHEGCRKALADCLSLEPVRRESEGSSIRIEAGFDPAQVRLVGNVVGHPPFSGNLNHPGWRAKDVKLPRPPRGADPAILAPAEVELP